MNTKIKSLSLALFGLAGFAFAGAAMAQCPTNLVPPWGVVSAFSGGTVTSTAGGLDGSACKLSTALGATFSSQAAVTDNTPANETRYRFQFLVNADALGNFASLDSVNIFTANSNANFPATGGGRQMVRVSLVAAAGGAKRLSIVAACDNAASSYRCIATSPNLVAGVNRVEVDLVSGASGTAALKYWLNAAAGTTEPAATGTIAITGGNAGWVGVKQAVLGLAVPSPSYRTAHATQVVNFDTFDSRRQTYIGH